MFDCIDSSTCCANDFIQDCKRCLKRGELDQCLDGFGVDFTGFDNLLSTAAKTSQIEIWVLAKTGLVPKITQIKVRAHLSQEPDPPQTQVV